jgi:hypothetical protein
MSVNIKPEDPRVDAVWSHGLQALKEYKAREGHCNVPRIHKEGYVNLGAWLNEHRSAYNKGTLSTERIAILEEVGFSFDPYGERWKAGLKALTEFKKREKHCNIPSVCKEGDFNLGQWVRDQRASFKRGSMPTERAKHLGEIGLTLDANLHLQDLLNRSIAQGLDAIKENGVQDDIAPSFVNSQRQRVSG